MHFVYDDELSQKRGRPHVSVSHHQRRKEHLVDCADRDGAHYEALRVFRRPAAKSESIAVWPHYFKGGETASFGIVDTQVSWHGQHDWRRLSEGTSGRRADPFKHLCCGSASG
jgi:hypothetical protein